VVADPVLLMEQLLVLNIAPQMASQVCAVGISLGVPYERIRNLEIENRYNMEQYAMGVFKYWMNNKKWTVKELEEALEKAGRRDLSIKLHTLHKDSPYNEIP
jgi:hypothetical protein